MTLSEFSRWNPSAGHKGSHIESCERRKVTGLHCLRYAESSIG